MQVDAAEPKKAQLGYVELAKQQEQKAEAQANQAKQVVQAAPKGKKARKKRKRSPEVLRSEGTWERSHVIPKADLNRDDTVNFGEDMRDADAPRILSQTAMRTDRFLNQTLVKKGVCRKLQPLHWLRAWWNGMMGTLNTWNASTERWSVLIDGHLKLLKKENLEVKALLRVETPDLNGKSGLCREWKSEKMRWLVAVEGHEDVLLKAENLQVLLKPGLQVQLCGLQKSELNETEAVCYLAEPVRGHQVMPDRLPKWKVGGALSLSHSWSV
eukprot:g3934.t1